MLCNELYFAIASVTISESIQNVELHSVTVSGRILIRISVFFRVVWFILARRPPIWTSCLRCCRCRSWPGPSTEARTSSEQDLSSTIGLLSADRYFIYRCFNRDILFHLCHRPAIVNLAHTPGDRQAVQRGTLNAKF